MRITLALNGSRGDVQPGIAVAQAMTDRGHDVVVGVPENLVEFTAGHGVETRPYAPDSAELLRSPLIQRDLKSSNPRTRSRAIREVTEFGAETMDERLLEMSDGADLVVTGLMNQERGATVAEYRGAAYVPLHYCPVRPNRSVPVPLGPLAALSAVPALTGALWSVVDLAFWWGSARRSDNALRERLGMRAAGGPLGSRLRDAGTPEIQAYDPALFPRLEAEWGEQRPMTGFLTPAAVSPRAGRGSTDDTDTDETLAWIDAGPAPVYIGFGSMPLPDPVATLGSLVTVARAAGHRVLVCCSTDVEAARTLAVDDAVRVVAAVDHARALPHCVAAVHHGGAGTTGACLRAGVPSLVAAFSADQPMWGRAVVDAGLGATCGIRQTGERDLLERKVGRILDTDTRARARSFARTTVAPEQARTRTASILESAV